MRSIRERSMGEAMIDLGSVVFCSTITGHHLAIMGEPRVGLLRAFRESKPLYFSGIPVVAKRYRTETGEVNWPKITPEMVEWGDWK